MKSQFTSLAGKKIIVTGGCGFIGSNIVKHLITCDVAKIRIIDNLSNGTLDNVKEYIDHPIVDILIGDIMYTSFIIDAFEGYDIVCHQAAIASVPRSIMNPRLYHDNNVTGFINVLEACRHHGIRRVVYASSSSVYGDDVRDAKIEESIGKQLSPYAMTKYMNEVYGNLYNTLYGMECVGLRYFNVFGPGQNSEGEYAGVIPKFITNILKGKSVHIYGDGMQMRDFTYIDSVVFANLSFMNTHITPITPLTPLTPIYNVGTGENHRIISILCLIIRLIGADRENIEIIKCDNRVGDVKNSLADITKLVNAIGSYDRPSMDVCLNSTIEYYRKIVVGEGRGQ